MEYVPGRTLRDVLRQYGPLTPEQALVFLDPVLEALAAAHAAGFVHRDIKPENVLISDDGRVKVADFGLARAVEANGESVTQGMIIGTVAYLSPEQVERGEADGRSDVYAAGILLFEMITGQVPARRREPAERGLPARQQRRPAAVEHPRRRSRPRSTPSSSRRRAATRPCATRTPSTSWPTCAACAPRCRRRARSSTRTTPWSSTSAWPRSSPPAGRPRRSRPAAPPRHGRRRQHARSRPLAPVSRRSATGAAAHRCSSCCSSLAVLRHRLRRLVPRGRARQDRPGARRRRRDGRGGLGRPHRRRPDPRGRPRSSTARTSPADVVISTDPRGRRGRAGRRHRDAPSCRRAPSATTCPPSRACRRRRRPTPWSRANLAVGTVKEAYDDKVEVGCRRVVDAQGRRVGQAGHPGRPRGLQGPRARPRPGGRWARSPVPRRTPSPGWD